MKTLSFTVILLFMIPSIAIAQNESTSSNCIPRNEFQSTIDNCVRYGNDLAKEKAIADDLESIVCRIDDRKLLDGYDSLPNYGKEYLKTFVKIQEPVDVFQFADAIDSLAIGTAKARIETYASRSLDTYTKLGFAQSFCYPTYSERYGINTTVCLYMPIINDYCLNKTTSLARIKSIGRLEGVVNTFVYMSIGTGFLFIGLVLTAKAPLMPFR